MALAWFWGLMTPGQWIVTILVISVVIGILGSLQAWADNEPEPWLAFIMTPLMVLFLLFCLTVLLTVISLCQWLWTLGVSA